MGFLKFNKKIFAWFILALRFTLPDGTIFAQDSTNSIQKFTLSEVVVSSSKLQTKLKDVSTKIEIINEERVKNSNGTRLPEILKSTGAAFIKSYGLTPQLQSISSNGLGAQHTLVLVDGVRLNSFQNSQVDLSLIPLQNIERIEVINNGISSIYGSDAIGGVVNIITKNRSLIENNKDYKLSISASNGSFNTNGYSLSMEKQTSGFNIYLFYNSEKSDGNFKYNFNNGSGNILKERENSSYSLYDIGINTQYLINNSNRIRFISTYTYQNKNLPGIVTGSVPPNTKQLDKNWNNILISENTISSKFTLLTSLNFQNNFMNYSVGNFLNSNYRNLVYSFATEMRFRNKLLKLTSGYNFTNARLKSNSIQDGTERNQHAIFISAQFDFYNKFKLFPSARYDYITDIKQGAATYKLGINYQPFKKYNLSIKGNVGKNFRAPSFNDLYWKPGGNINLNPENSFNAESGLFYSFNSFVKGQFDLSYTYIYAKNKIIWLPGSGGIWSPENIEESVSKNVSINLTANKKINQKLLLGIEAGIKLINSKKISETYLNDAAKNKQFPYIPKFLSNLNLSFTYNKLGINLTYNHTGNRYSDAANTKSLSPINTIDGNIKFGFKFWKVYLSTKFEVNNIFNSNYEIINGYPMPLRNYRITLFINY